MLPPGFYCERLGLGPWDEPLNALSNFGFLLAAGWLGWRQAPRSGRAAGAVRLLAGLLALVGLASLSFHTRATTFTQILDVAFIGLFNVVYLVLFGRLVLAWTRRGAALAALAFVAIDQLRGLLLPAGFLYGSAMYLPPLLVLLLLAGAARRRSPAAAAQMLQAAAVFSISLLARTLDRPLCPLWPAGLHFVWHLLNAWVLLRLVTAFALGAVTVASPDPGARHAEDRR